MAPSIIESFDITINDHIVINEFGEASCKRNYRFQNRSGKQLPPNKYEWNESFPVGTSEFYHLRNEERISLSRISNEVEIPIALMQTIEPNGFIDVTIEYKWTNFAKNLGNNLVFIYQFKTLTKVTLKIKIDLTPSTKITASAYYYIFKKSKGDSSAQELKSKGSVIEGQFDDMEMVNFTGFYYHGFKWWIEGAKALLYGTGAVIIFEKYLRSVLL